MLNITKLNIQWSIFVVSTCGWYIIYLYILNNSLYLPPNGSLVFSEGRVTLWWSRGVLDLFGKNFQLFVFWSVTAAGVILYATKSSSAVVACCGATNDPDEGTKVQTLRFHTRSRQRGTDRLLWCSRNLKFLPWAGLGNINTIQAPLKNTNAIQMEVKILIIELFSKVWPLHGLKGRKNRDYSADTVLVQEQTIYLCLIKCPSSTF